MTLFSFRAAACWVATACALVAVAGTADAKPRHHRAATRPAAPRPAPATPPYGDREDVVRFASELAAQRPQLDAAQLRATLAQARYQPAVAQLILPAASPAAKNWAAYRARMVDERRIAAGLAFWDEHAATLQAAEQRWPVPAQIVVAIIGIETFYGRHTGGFRAIDALATLAFDFPAGRSDRSGFFRDELAELLTLAAEQGVDPATLRSSYAGALGLPQFMPSTWRKHAVDFDGDGHIDLHSNVADVIGSVAHYLVAYGWQPGLPTHYGVTPPDDTVQRALLLQPDIRPTFTATQMAQAGATLDAAGQRHEGLLALVELRNGEAAPSHVAGTQNFWVVTRYNWSAYYAMAVIELAQALAERRAAAEASRPR